MAMLASKRLADTAAAEEALRQPKKRKTASTTDTTNSADHTNKSGSPSKDQRRKRPQKTLPESSRPNTTTVVPATPGTRVQPLPTTKRGKKGAGSLKKGADCFEADGGAPLKQKEQSGKEENSRQRGAKKQKLDKVQQHQPPSTLPTEPHAAFLAELQPHHNVRVLSVISSSRMEKRIKAVLEHLGGRLQQPPDAGPLEPAAEPLPAPATGVVLLHARASHASKMISIVEIVKRRIREGCFADSATAAADAATEEKNGTEDPKQTKKRKQKKRRAAQGQTAWYQYNRLYDVESAVSGAVADHAANGTGGDEAEDDDDDDFEPMPQQFQEALADKPTSATTTTYMSIVLSRVPLPVLERHPEITAQTSGDPIETEYQSWISSKT